MYCCLLLRLLGLVPQIFSRACRELVTVPSLTLVRGYASIKETTQTPAASPVGPGSFQRVSSWTNATTVGRSLWRETKKAKYNLTATRE
jgi:hypothetical protein